MGNEFYFLLRSLFQPCIRLIRASLRLSRKGHIPYPSQLVLSSASENDLSVFKRECVPYIANKTIFADKIYRDNPYWDMEAKLRGNELLTHVKTVKGMTKEEIQRNKAADSN